MKPTDDAGIGASLAERLAFERLLADLSATYANVPGDGVIGEIERGLGRLNEFLGFDRSTFRELDADGNRIALCSVAAGGDRAGAYPSFPLRPRAARQRSVTGSARVSCLLGVGLALACVCVATAQGPTPAPKGTVAPSAGGKPDIALLKGTWVRLEGGYIIAIKGIGPRGELEATYFNPNPLPFAKAQASRDGATLRAFFELRAAGYGGSTYELTYDPASDRLKGTYYQAVAQQKFDVSFARK